MKSINSVENIIYPPGTTLNTKPNTTISGYVDIENFSNQILPTFPQAVKINNNISITTVIFINTTITDLKLKINCLFTISSLGTPQLQLFIHYDIDERQRITNNKTIANRYNAFTVTFTIENSIILPDGYFLNDIELIETFLWDIDPKTSRGTVTTVQQVAPNN